MELAPYGTATINRINAHTILLAVTPYEGLIEIGPVEV
jgi:hypothetical protein